MRPSFILRCTSSRAGKQIRPNRTSATKGRNTKAIIQVIGKTS